MHQARLEIRNEELANARNEIAAGLDRYANLFEFSPCGHFDLDPGGTILLVNLAGARLLGGARPHLVGRRLQEFVAGGDRPTLERFLAQVFAHEDKQACELVLDTGAAPTVTVRIEATRSPDGRECLAILIDLSARLRSEAALRESEALFRLELTASREQLRGLVARLHRTREEERIRIAREVHDELGQQLTGLKMDLRWLERKLSEPGAPPVFAPLLERAMEATELANAAIASVQRIAAELRPGTLDHLGLEAALAETARRFQKNTGIICTLTNPGRSLALHSDIRTELYHVCQEALTNVSRHAQATQVEIGLRAEGGAVELEIRDNGVGMPEALMRAPGSLGLIGMRERAVLCGGTIAFARNQPRGTRVTVRVPIASELSLQGNPGGTVDLTRPPSAGSRSDNRQPVRR